MLKVGKECFIHWQYNTPMTCRSTRWLRQFSTMFWRLISKKAQKSPKQIIPFFRNFFIVNEASTQKVNLKGKQLHTLNFRENQLIRATEIKRANTHKTNYIVPRCTWKLLKNSEFFKKLSYVKKLHVVHLEEYLF